MAFQYLFSLINNLLFKAVPEMNIGMDRSVVGYPFEIIFVFCISFHLHDL